MTDRVYKGACSFFFTGFLPRFPGTWGTLGALILGAAVWAAGADPFFWAPGAALFVANLSVPLGDMAKARFGTKDPGQFVLDEVAGFYVSIMFLGEIQVWTWAAAFAAFRLFDIWKPWPVRKMEGLPGGWGILLDDILAGVLANIVVRFLALGIGLF